MLEKTQLKKVWSLSNTLKSIAHGATYSRHGTDINLHKYMENVFVNFEHEVAIEEVEQTLVLEI